ncbi:MAG: hypothetical protein LBQ70_01810, partial [Prevotellaceae bacterium]|nr:hypothetical protein [Prevotellaceae bacterium]
MSLNYLQNKCIKAAIAAVLLCISSFGGYAQNSATEGKDFYLVFGKNAYPPTCRIRYVVTKTCYVTAQYKDGTYIDNNVQYTPGTYEKTVDLTKCYISTASSSKVTNMGIRVTATENISLYAINLESLSTDATTVLPVSNLGNDYTVISHDTDN